jgi:hypothetical protein
VCQGKKIVCFKKVSLKGNWGVFGMCGTQVAVEINPPKQARTVKTRVSRKHRRSRLDAALAASEEQILSPSTRRKQLPPSPATLTSDTSGDEAQPRQKMVTKQTDVNEKSAPRRPRTPYKYPPPLGNRIGSLDESMAFGEVQLNGLLIV